MSIPDSYTRKTGEISRLLDSLVTAGVPERVTFEFLKTLGFTSSDDRTLISVLKTIGFLTESGVPTDLYKQYRNPANSGVVLAEALKQSYSDLFLANTKVFDLTADKVKGIVAAKTGKNDAVAMAISRTFLALAKKADFTAASLEVQPSEATVCASVT